MSRRIEFFLPGPTFTWREKKKTHKGKCPSRGHCTVTKTGRHPETKGNRQQVVRRGRHVGITQSKRAIAAEEALIKELQLLPSRPEVPLGDVRLDVTFVFEPPTSWPQWRQQAALKQAVRATGHNLGDRGQLLKMIEDGLERAGYYADDARVTEGDVAKAWGLEQGYHVVLQELPRSPATAKEWRSMREAG